MNANKIVLFVIVLLGATSAVRGQPMPAAGQRTVDTSVPGLTIGGASRQQLKQEFTSAAGGRFLTQVRLPVSCEPGSDLIIEIQDVDFRSPNNGKVLTSTTIPGSSLPGPPPADLRILRLTTPVQIGENHEYGIILKSAGTCTVSRGPVGNPYDEGDLFFDALPNSPGWICFCDFPGARRDLPFLVIVDLLSLPSQFRRLPETGQKTWQAAATASQIPGFSPIGVPRSRIQAALWFNDFADVATLEFGDQGGAQVSRVTLRCGPAGTEGPIIWSGGPQDLSGVTFELYTRDLSAASSAGCAATIKNVASLRAAADARLLYLEMERDGPRVRGQLWARPVGSPGLGFTAGASAQQAVGAQNLTTWTRATASLWFAEEDGLTSIGYRVPERHLFRSVALHCAPAGRTGDILALLPAEEGVLLNEDVIRTEATGPCGVAVNNTASLLEAVMRGNVYVVLEALEPVGLELRGQFPVP